MEKVGTVLTFSITAITNVGVDVQAMEVKSGDYRLFNTTSRYVCRIMYCVRVYVRPSRTKEN